MPPPAPPRWIATGTGRNRTPIRIVRTERLMNSANHPRQLHTVMYHYVRDLPRSRFPRIKGMLLAEFRAQVARLAEAYEMATLESALAFLHGDYLPKRDL